MFCPSKANSWRFKGTSCNRNEPYQYINTWQIAEVSKSKRRHADNSGNHADLLPIKICHNIILRLNSTWNSSFITEHKMPFMNTSKAAKMVGWPNRELGGGTWPKFGYRGVAEGFKSWPCLGQKYSKKRYPVLDNSLHFKTLFRTSDKIHTEKPRRLFPHTLLNIKYLAGWFS